MATQSAVALLISRAMPEECCDLAETLYSEGLEGTMIILNLPDAAQQERQQLYLSRFMDDVVPAVLERVRARSISVMVFNQQEPEIAAYAKRRGVLATVVENFHNYGQFGTVLRSLRMSGSGQFVIICFSAELQQIADEAHEVAAIRQMAQRN